MKIFLTGGSSDLGKVLSYRLQNRGDTAVRFDIRTPSDSYGQFISGSILDREALSKYLVGIDCVIHIAAWHGFHEFTKQKNVYEFWDLNVTGTFNVFQAALENNIKNIVFISSESVADQSGMYGWTKVLGEHIAQRYFDHHHLNVITLRPRAFIPYWNREVYKSFVDFAKWYWKGAVHINDVAQAVMNGIDLLIKSPPNQHLVLPVDGAYEYTENDLLCWDNSDKSFLKYYEKYYDVAVQYGLDPLLKPIVQDISETKKWLSYKPFYSLMNLLDDLSRYGEQGPPIQLDWKLSSKI